MSKATLVSIVLGALVMTATPAPGDVSVYGDGWPVSTLINGTITDDSDPVSGPWQPNGPIVPGTLQGNGGPPDVAFRALTEWPVVVWAATGAVNHDIAFAEWDGTGWSSIENLTAGPADELAPRVFVEDDGTVHVVWWQVVVPGTVYLSSRPAGSSTWTTPLKVNATIESARRPSVAVFNDKVWVAYERDSGQPGMAQDVVLARLKPSGDFERILLASTSRSDELDVVLHVREGGFWADWKHDEGEFAESQFVGGGWSGVDLVPWLDPSWVGVEAVRKAIMQEMGQE